MDTSIERRVLAGLRAPLAVLSVACCVTLGSMVLAQTSEAAAPPLGHGIGCVASDGKISGRGSTYQNLLQKDFATRYAAECGVRTVEYNNQFGEYTELNAKTGSGKGLIAATCRTDAFAGTDLPYSTKQLEELNGPVGELEKDLEHGECNPSGYGTPYTPLKPFPSGEDKEAKLMSFPVGGSAVALDVNLAPADCAGGSAHFPRELKLTAKEVARLYGGEVSSWADTEIDGTDTKLAQDGCTGTITRVVRLDSSGTTNLFKEYLEKVEPGTRSGSCDPGNTWASFNSSSNNTPWPEGSGCSTLKRGTESGNPGVIKALEATPNAVGYNDLAEAIGHGFLLATVQNATTGAYESPENGNAANCNFSGTSLPSGGTPEGALGLNVSDSWASNNAIPHSNVANEGEQYPICGLTFDLVYTGLSRDESETEMKKTAISRLTADQRRTEYSYFLHVFSETYQEIANELHYSALPSLWLPTLRAGWEAALNGSANNSF